MATLSISVMIGLLSFAVDMGWGYFRREAAQSAADAAATAAVRAVQTGVTGTPACGNGIVWCGSPAGAATNCPATKPSSATNTYDNACMLAASNGYTTAGSTTVSVQANTTTPFNGATVSYWVTVRIAETPTTFFALPFFSNALTNNVIASAAMTTTTVQSDCIYILGGSETTLTMANGVDITASGCGVSVASNSSSAASVTGGATLTTNFLDLVGGEQVNNGGKIVNSKGQTLSPTTVSSVSDPFASITPPTVPSSCTAANYSSWQASAYTPGPGCYSSFSVSNGVTVDMQAGTYIINGGSFSLTGGTLSASGVMIYLTNGASVTISNGMTVTMSPESSGTYEGILFFQDRSDSATANVAGGSNMKLSGSLYFPDATLNINNGSNTETEALVANSVNFQGGATFNVATKQNQTGIYVGGTTVSVMQ